MLSATGPLGPGVLIINRSLARFRLSWSLSARFAADDLIGPLADAGAPEGVRLAEGDLVRRREVGGDHNGAPLRQERTGAGVRGLRPRPSVAPAAAREAGGSKGGAASARQSPVFNTGSAGLPAKLASLTGQVALVTAVTRAHGGPVVVMPCSRKDDPHPAANSDCTAKPRSCCLQAVVESLTKCRPNRGATTARD